MKIQLAVVVATLAIVGGLWWFGSDKPQPDIAELTPEEVRYQVSNERRTDWTIAQKSEEFEGTWLKFDGVIVNVEKDFGLWVDGFSLTIGRPSGMWVSVDIGRFNQYHQVKKLNRGDWVQVVASINSIRRNLVFFDGYSVYREPMDYNEVPLIR